MFCHKCGNNLAAEAVFCVYCGVAIAEELTEALHTQQQAIPIYEAVYQPQATAPESNAVAPHKKDKPSSKGNAPRGKYIGIGAGATAIVLAALFILMNIVGVIQFVPSKTTYEGSGYNTPEEAATAYVDALKSMEWERLWSTFAIESFVEHYDFEYSIERLRSYSPNLEQPAPNLNEFSYNANVQRRLGAAAPPISQFDWVLTEGRPVAFGVSGSQPEDNELIPAGLSCRQFSRFLEDYTYEKQQQLQSMVITDIVLPDGLDRFGRKYWYDGLGERYLSDDNQGVLEQITQVYGADEIVDIIIVLNANNEECFMFPQLVRYGEKWYILKRDGYVGMMFHLSAYQLRFQSMVSIDELRQANER